MFPNYSKKAEIPSAFTCESMTPQQHAEFLAEKVKHHKFAVKWAADNNLSPEEFNRCNDLYTAIRIKNEEVCKVPENNKVTEEQVVQNMAEFNQDIVPLVLAEVLKCNPECADWNELRTAIRATESKEVVDQEIKVVE